MIYTYGINGEFEETDKEYIYEYFKGREIMCDSETLGLDCHTSSLLCIQLGDYDNQFVIHGDKVGEFKELLETNKLLFHNAKFDLKFLYKNNIWPREVYDTMLAEAVLFCGIKTHKKALNAVAKNRLGIDLDKSVRDSIGKEGLTKRVIEYAADDVKYLCKIRDLQEKDLQKWKLEAALEMENQYVLSLAYIEFCGIGFNKEAWLEKCKKDQNNLLETENVLNKYIIENNLQNYINKQLDLFSIETTTTINWASSKQVVVLFKELGINTKTIVEGEEKDSVEAKHIEKYKDEFPIIEKYIAYKEADKLVSTYGESWLDKISPATGRIHTTYQQIMDTGRISSGNKRDKTPNLQNIPKDEETRNCFIAEHGNNFVVADFTAQEDMIFVEYSREQKMIEFYNDTTRKRDGHSFVAKMCFPEDLKNIAEEEVKHKRGDLRDMAKKAKFAIHYGGNGATIAANINIPMEDGHAIYEGYMTGFPGIAAYFKRVKAESLRNGYILISPKTGRKSFIWGYDKYRELSKEINSRFWEQWKTEKKRYIDEDWASPKYLEMKRKIKEFFQIKGEIEKKALNYPIQGSAGETTKLATIFFFEWIREKQLFNTVKIVNTVHDEIDLECPPEYTEKAAGQLEKDMSKAGDMYCTVVKLKADTTISTKWQK